MKGPRVQALQAKLTALGYDPGVADGLFGARTKAAVQKFQTDKGLVADGLVGPQTQAALG
jgi:peptidoglycan hydrolase-like protein with peptidoglycan-binding domain